MILSSSDFIFLFASSFSLVSLLTPIMRKIAIRFGVVDSPNESHKTHIVPVPYLGGVAIVIGIISVSYGALILSGFSSKTFWLLSSVLIPGIILAIIGIFDDLRNLSPWPRFLAQNAIGVFSTVVLISTNTVGNPTGSQTVDVLVTMFWVVGLSNSINFFDNLDGGATGTVAISSVFLFLLAVQSNQFLVASLSLVVAGSTLGFLVWNRPPARIYMGDAGSLFLGLVLASLTIRLEPNPINKWASLSVPIFLVAIPILDTSVVVTKRLFRGISPFQGGKDHLSHRLFRLELSKKSTVITLWLLTTYFGSLAFVLSNAPYEKEGLVLGCGLVTWLFLFFFFAKQADS